MILLVPLFVGRAACGGGGGVGEVEANRSYKQLISGSKNFSWKLPSTCSNLFNSLVQGPRFPPDMFKLGSL